MLFLADTSIWIDHFRHTNAKLGNLLGRRNILLHPFVLGELALGHVPNLEPVLN
jgi:predicted nucleic acid-binding protein